MVCFLLALLLFIGGLDCISPARQKSFYGKHNSPFLWGDSMHRINASDIERDFKFQLLQEEKVLNGKG